jgi:hypothetical protein
MRAIDFLCESYDRQRTLDSIGPEALMKRMTPRDWSDAYAHFEGKSVSRPAELERVCKSDADEHRFYRKWLMDFIMDLCEQADPTKTKRFVPVILRWYYKGRGMSYFEDINKAYEALETFIKFKNRIKGLDPKAIDFYDFMDKMDEVSAIPSGSEQDRAAQQEFFDKGEAKLVVDTERAKVVIPLTMAAAQYFGRGTRWCTSGKRDNRFAQYNRQGPLYIIMFKGMDRRWQWHFQTKQFMDEKDEDNLLIIKRTLPEYPELMTVWDEGQRGILHQRDHVMIHDRTQSIYHMFHPTLDDLRKAANDSVVFARVLAKTSTPRAQGMAWALTWPSYEERKEIVIGVGAEQVWYNHNPRI